MSDDLDRLRRRAYGGDEPLTDAEADRLTTLERADRARRHPDHPATAGHDPARGVPTRAHAAAPRRRLPAGVAVAVVVAAGAAGAAGFLWGQQSPAAAPSPAASYGADTSAGAASVLARIDARKEQVEANAAWDAGTVRLMVWANAGDVWWGTRADGAVTCVVLQWGADVIEMCGDTEAVRSDGLTWGSYVRSGDDWRRTDTYLVNPYETTFVVESATP